MGLLAEAWSRTELIGIKRIAITVGLSLAILIWNEVSGIRGWRQTEVFGLDAIVGYATLTLLEFLFYLGILWVKQHLLAFQRTIAQEVRDSLIKETPEKSGKIPHLSPARAERIRAFLATQAPLPRPLVIWVLAGYPNAYAFAQELKSIIEAVDSWKVTASFTTIPASGVMVYFSESETSQYKSLVFQLLTHAGIYFSTRKNDDANLDDAVVVIGSQVMLSDET